MKNICILGNGITAYILALLLNENKIYISENDLKIKKSKDIGLSNVISIKLNDLSEEENKFLKNKINYDDCIVHKKAGYKYNGKIYNLATTEMIHDYLTKQKRDIIFDFKFETEFDAIDIVSLISKYKDNIEVISDKNLPKENAIYFITNQQYERDSLDTSEFVVNTDNEMFGYSYIYDCDLYSNVKRYSRNNNECINYIENAKEVKNYYEKPKVFSEYDFKKNLEKYWIGRFATKTRMEQIDVLKFCIKFIKRIEGEQKYEKI